MEIPMEIQIPVWSFYEEMRLANLLLNRIGLVNLSLDLVLVKLINTITVEMGYHCPRFDGPALTVIDVANKIWELKNRLESFENFIGTEGISYCPFTNQVNATAEYLERTIFVEPAQHSKWRKAGEPLYEALFALFRDAGMEYIDFGFVMQLLVRLHNGAF